MKTLIAGDPATAAALASRLAGEGIESHTSPPGEALEGIPALATALVELERELTERPPGTVVLADGGDHALAATLVAAKLLVPVIAVAERGDGEPGANERVLELLAETATVDALPGRLKAAA